jgi:membrane-associated phospholipid phosphatase
MIPTVSNRKPAVILLVLALFTGAARVLAGVHFWYDIVGGAILGYMTAYVAWYLYKKLFSNF